MRPHLRPIALTVLLAAASLAAAAPAAAQPQTLSRRGGNQEMIDAAVESYGFDARRLTPAQEAALDDAWERLLPGVARATYRLNPTQALAVAYVGLVLRQQPDGGGRGRRRDEDRLAVCRPVIDAVFELAANSPVTGGAYGVLSDEEVAAARGPVLNVQRLATECGCPPLATAAADVTAVLNRTAYVNRQQAHAWITNFTTVAQRCTAP